MVLNATVTPGAQLRAAWNEKPGPLIIPGVFNALTAKMAERSGFRAVYQSGAALSASLAALPDVGLVTQTEFAEQGRYLADAVSIPVVSDADTGFGDELNVSRTVQLFESAGLAGLHLEDQTWPKRCGHLEGKSLITAEEMCEKLRAAVVARRDSEFVIMARTDARSVEGFDAAVIRAKSYIDAGADMIFPEALESADEFARFAEAIEFPLLANMTEFGRSPILSASDLRQMGYTAVLFPVTVLRAAMKAVESTLAAIRDAGTQRHLFETLQTRAELYEILGYDMPAPGDASGSD